MTDTERGGWTNEGLATRLIQLEGVLLSIGALAGSDMELEEDNALREAARRLLEHRGEYARDFVCERCAYGFESRKSEGWPTLCPDCRALHEGG